MKGFIVTITLFCMIGCTRNDKNTSAILSRQKMQAVMWDIISADVFTEQFVKKDSLKNAPVENMHLQNKIFAIHHVTRADFYKSYEFYISHNDQMKVILDSMSAKAERDRSKMTYQRRGSQPK